MIWESLEAHPGWQALSAILADELNSLQHELEALAKESSDPRVRGIAWKMSAIGEVLRKPKDEMERHEEEG